MTPGSSEVGQAPSADTLAPSPDANVQDRLAEAERFLDRIGRVAGVGGWKLDLANGTLTWTAETCRIHDRPADHRPTLEEAIAYYEPEVRAVLEAAVMRGIEFKESWDLELPLTTAQGRHIWVRAQGALEEQDGRPSCLIGAFQDITDRRRDIDALIASERRFRSLFTYSLGLICTHDLSGILRSVNPSACRSLGFAEAELVGRSIADLMPEQDARGVERYLSRIAARGSDAGRLRFIAADGSIRIWQYHNVLDTLDGETCVLGHAQDITDQVQQEEQLREWSIRDALTSCYNRRYLAEFTQGEGRGKRWACVMVDLDHFKAINDTFGHDRGDEVLVQMSAFFLRHTRPDDRVVRMGGDEFLILMPEVDEDAAGMLATRLASDAASAPCGFTLGAAAHTPGESAERTLARADQVLYVQRRARRAGNVR
jgi:diguanylate cyclase (GGDEF)-like protein/PAS domain S-box-containing protein